MAKAESDDLVTYSGFNVDYSKTFEGYWKDTEKLNNYFYSQKSKAEYVLGSGISNLEFSEDCLSFSLSDYTLPKSKVCLNVKLRVNPSRSFRKCSKLWVNVMGDNFKMNGDEISDIFSESRSYCKSITSVLGKFIDENIKFDDYWISIEKALMSKEVFKHQGIDSVFMGGEFTAEEFFNEYEKSISPKKAMTDVIKWLYNEQTEDPIVFMSNNKYKETEWKIDRNNEVRLFYGERNCEEFYHISGVGEILSEKEDISALANILLYKVNTINAAL